ncbi:MAG: hypothetical protein QXD89_02555 [Candidatus Aenigmatarchaeota archaeon]
MILEILTISFSFLFSLILVPFFIQYFKTSGIVTKDLHKKNKPFLPHSLGVPFVLSITFSLFFYVFGQVLLYQNYKIVSYIFASLLTLLLITLAGFLDDVNTSQVKFGKYEEGKAGLKKFQKVLLTVPAAFPLMSVMIGDTKMNLPFFGTIDFGIWYSLLIVPIGIVGASNAVNMLDGFNGLACGLGLIYTFSLGIYALVHGSLLASLILLTSFSSLLVCFKYNFYPAKILSGDSLTYSLGSLLAIGAIVGNMEKATLIVFIPFFIQAILKFYSRIKLGYFASDLGILQKNGKIKCKYKQVFSLTHLAMKLNLKESQIVLFLMLIQAFFAVLPFLLFR